MKTSKLFTVVLTAIFSIQFSHAQAPVEKETIKVYGNCGMCKKTIESSAKTAGAGFANWNTETKQLNISYDPSVTSGVKIQEAIANSGYDTQDFSGSDSAYNQLPECCKYERKEVAKSKSK